MNEIGIDFGLNLISLTNIMIIDPLVDFFLMEPIF